MQAGNESLGNFKLSNTHVSLWLTLSLSVYLFVDPPSAPVQVPAAASCCVR